MSPVVTLEKIKSEHAKVAEMIAAFEAQSKVKTLRFPEIEIELLSGEHYAGIITGKDGELSYHVILIDGDLMDVAWDNAKELAANAGGELPTRREQALLYANLKEQFQESAYWSCEEYASGSGYAWYQVFDDGYQGYDFKGHKLRARFVRRLPIL